MHAANLTVILTSGAALRANPLVRVKAKFAVKNGVCEESSGTADGVLDCDFGLNRTSGAALRALDLH